MSRIESYTCQTHGVAPIIILFVVIIKYTHINIFILTLKNNSE